MQNKLLVVIGIVGVAALSIGVVVGQGLLLAPQTNQVGVDDVQERGIPKSTIEAEASEKEPWEELGLLDDPNEGEPTEEIAEDIQQFHSELAIQEELDRIDAKEGTSYSMVLADDRIKDYIEGAHQVSSDYVPSENRQNTDTDKLTLTVTGKEIVEGSWDTSYTIILTGMFALDMEVKDDAIVSIEKIPLDDIQTVVTYSDEEKRIMKMALDNPEIQTALADKGNVATVMGVYTHISNEAMNCPPGNCALVSIKEVNSHAMLMAYMNTQEGTVVTLDRVSGW